MVIKKRRYAWFLLLLVMVPLAAKADIQSIRDSDNAVWLTGGFNKLDYREFQSGDNHIDSDRGILPSFATGIQFLTSPQSRYPNLYFALQGGGTFGFTHYNGSYLFSNKPDLATDPSITWDVQGRFGRAFALNNAFLVTPFAELGFQVWHRGDPNGYNEDYQHETALGGLMLQYSPIQKLVFTLDGAVGTTFGASMQSTTPPLTYNLQDSLVWKIDGAIGYALTQHWELISRVSYTQFNYGASNSVFDPTLGSFTLEPDSETQTFSTQIGVAYHF